MLIVCCLVLVAFYKNSIIEVEMGIMADLTGVGLFGCVLFFPFSQPCY